MLRYLKIIVILILVIGGAAWLGKGFFQNLINQYFPFQAAVVETLAPEAEEIISLETESEEEKIEEGLEEEILSDLEADFGYGGPSPSQDLIEIQDEIDEIAERIDILSQEVAELIEQMQSLVEDSEESEEDEKEKKEEESEEEEEIEELEEKEVGQEVGQEFCNIILGSQPSRNRVIINEIAWMGSFSSANDEWIELKNISNNEINLTSWQILDKDSQIKIIFSAGDPVSVRLPAGGFYLLERTDDNSVPNILADFIYKGALSDKDEALLLFDENCQLQDKVEALPDWPAGKKSERKTMERGEKLVWHTFNGIAQAGIFGTPKRENSQPEIFIPGSGGLPAPPSLPEPEFCSQENLSEPIYEPVIFNEIAWMGTLVDWRDEWLELKNISEEDVLLDGWQILDKDEEIKIIFSDGDRVSANGFYLLERTDDNSVPNILADKIYTGNLEDSNESLRLFDQSCNLIDEVLADPDWSAGQKEERRSMERKEDFDWQTYFGEGENDIMGTPKKENSQSPELKDTTVPLVSFDDISSLQINSEFIISWQGQDPEDTALPSGIEGFLFRYSEDKENWNYFPSENEYTVENQYNFLGENEHSYYFQIKARDKAGNESDWVEIMIEINNLPVVINEIAWTGTAESHTSEWIELFNNAISDISLEGWLLKAIDGTPVINLTGTISGKSFYLLERTDDDTLPDIEANQIYTGALGNSGEKLELYGLDNQLIDEVICKEDDQGNCTDWLAGDNTTKQTMERKNPCLPGGNIENWEMSQEPGGTPKAQNSNHE